MGSAATKEDKDQSTSLGRKVAVVGAGISGLAAAYKLKSNGYDVTVFEAEGRAGGKLRSVSQDGFIWDVGANTMTESDMEVTTLLDQLGVRETQQFPISQNKRYIARNGMPVLVPTNPIALITSSILSTKSKFQIILEPFLWKKNDPSKTFDAYAAESVGEFFHRHFGEEVVNYLIDPIVAGTSGGDPESLSVQHSFPELWNLENRFGSIIAGAIQAKLSAKKDRAGDKKGSGKKKQHGSFSYFGGMQTLADRLCKEIEKDELRLGSKVLSLAYSCDSKSTSANWSVSLASKADKPSPVSPYDAVIMTVEYLPLSVMITTFKKENVKRPLEGFGVLIPSKEQQNGLKTLGTLFSSMMFPDRAPNDHYLYTTFVGGSRNKELAKASTNDLKQIVTSDLRQLLGVEGEPTFVNHFYWGKAFPLYGRNYQSVLEAIDKMERNLPGFFYAGNHKGGLSVGKSIASGCKAADLVISYLESSSGDDLKRK
ncbi:Protoporphyrinogen oxidase 2 [Linum perenne]